MLVVATKKGWLAEKRIASLSRYISLPPHNSLFFILKGAFVIKRACFCLDVALFFATGCFKIPAQRQKQRLQGGAWVTKAEVDQIAGQLHQQLAMVAGAGMFGTSRASAGAARQVIANELITKRHGNGI